MNFLRRILAAALVSALWAENAAACPSCVVTATNQAGIWSAVAFLFPVPFLVVGAIGFWSFKKGHFNHDK